MLAVPEQDAVGQGRARGGYLHAAPETAAHRDLVFRHATHDEASHPQPRKLVPDLHRVLCKERGCIHHLETSGRKECAQRLKCSRVGKLLTA